MSFTPSKGTDGLYAAATYTANFAEDSAVTIAYAATTGGSVSRDSETVAPATGSASGSTAAADSGYVFVNWTNEANQQVSAVLAFTPGKDATSGLYEAQTYTANFAKLYTLSYVWADPTDAPSLPLPGGSTNVYGTTFKLPSFTAIPEGWEFEGWYIPDDTGAAVKHDPDTDYTLTADQTATGVWNRKQYKVEYEFVDVTPIGATLPQETQVKYGSAVPQPVPTGEGYTFAGWKLERSDSASYVSANYLMPAEDIKLYGYWTINSHAVTYAYDATAPAGAPALPSDATKVGTFAYGAPLTVADEPTLEGYTFGGWRSSGVTPAADGTYAMPDNAVSFIGSWTAIDYNVTYEYIGAVPTGAPTTPASAVAHIGDTVAVAANPTLTGYTFSGWTTATPGVTVTQDATTGGDVFTAPASDVVFTGSWTINTYTITVTYDGDMPAAYQGASSSYQRDFGGSITIKKPAAVGFSLQNYTDANGTVYATSYVNNNVTADVALVGHWTRNAYNATFSYRGDVPANATDPSTYNHANVPYLSSFAFGAAPTAEGFTFDGWYRINSFGQLGTIKYTSGSFTMGSAAWAGNVDFAGTWSPVLNGMSVIGSESEYDGQPHGVSVSNLTTGDAVEYRQPDGSWSSTPTTLTDAGAITVEVRVKRAGVVIYGKKDSGEGTSATATVKVTKRLITVTVPSGSFSFNGQTHTVSLNPADYPTDAFVTVGSLVSGETLQALTALSDSATGLSSNQRDTVGSNPIRVSAPQIVKTSGDSTKNYQITVIPGAIQVGLGTAVGQPTSLTVVYDAKAHSPADTTAVFTAQEYVGGVETTVTLSPSGYEYTTASEYETDPTTAVWNAGKPQYTDAGTYAIYVRMTDARYAAAPVKQTLIIEQRRVLVSVADQSVTYNTLPQTAAYETEKDDGNGRGLLSGHALTAALLNGTLTNVGATTVTVDTAATTIRDATGDVKKNYIIETTPGTFTVLSATGSTASVAGYTGEYDGNSHGLGTPVLIDAQNNVIPASEITSTVYKWTDKDGDHSHNVSPVFTNATTALNAAGVIKVEVTIKTVNYGSLTCTAEVKITQRPLKVTLSQYNGVYDGQEHPITVAAVDGLLSGHQLSGGVQATDTRAQGDEPIDVGVYTATYKNLSVSDKASHTITDNYAPTIVDGRTVITTRTVRFAIDTVSVTFDGQEHHAVATLGTQGANEGFVKRAGQTDMESFTPVLSAAASQTYVTGATPVDATGYDNLRNGAKLTNYAPVTTSGSIEILRRDVTITAPSSVAGQFTYDGTDHSLSFDAATAVEPFNAQSNTGLPNGFSVSGVGFLNNSNVRRIDGTQAVQLDLGQMVVTGANLPAGVNAADQFNFSTKDGALTVDQGAIPITLSVAGTSHMFDGTPHTIDPDAYTLSGGALAGTNSTLTAMATSTAITDVGSTPTDIVNIVIKDGTDDVTANYVISKDCKDVVITKRPILFAVVQSSYVYDASAKYAAAVAGAVNGVGGPLSGTSLHAVLTGDGQTAVGNYNVSFNQPLTWMADAAGNAVDMNNYDVTWVGSTLSIRRATVRYRVNYYYNGVLDAGATLTVTGLDGTTVDAVPSRIRSGMRLDRVMGTPLTLSFGQNDGEINVYYVGRGTLELLVDVDTPLAGSMLGVNVGDCID